MTLLAINLRRNLTHQSHPEILFSAGEKCFYRNQLSKLHSIRRNSLTTSGLFLCLFLLHMPLVYATKSLEQMSIEELMNINIVGASKYEQKQQQVAAAVSIITRKDIRTYGWRTLNEALARL